MSNYRPPVVEIGIFQINDDLVIKNNLKQTKFSVAIESRQGSDLNINIFSWNSTAVEYSGPRLFKNFIYKSFSSHN